MTHYEFIQYVFVTLTYGRDEPETRLWARVARDWNRYIQRIRRLHGCSVGYLRTVEAHEDLYPHLHAILDFGHATIRVENVKFFDNSLYASWKNQWLFGHSDYQRPYSGKSSTPLLYILKYISKHSTKKTICRKVFTQNTVQSRDAKKSSELPTQLKPNASLATNSVAAKNVPTLMDNPSSFFCHQFKIKQCTWSRNFTFPHYQPKSLLVAQSLLTT